MYELVRGKRQKEERNNSITSANVSAEIRREGVQVRLIAFRADGAPVDVQERGNLTQNIDPPYSYLRDTAFPFLSVRTRL